MILRNMSNFLVPKLTGDMQAEHEPCTTGVAGEGMHAFWGGRAQLPWKGFSKDLAGAL